MKPLYTGVALAFSLLACSVDHWEGGGRRHELPSDNRGEEPTGGPSLEPGDPGAAGAPAGGAADASGGAAGFDGNGLQGGSGGSAGSGGVPIGLGSGGTAGLPGLP
jgi:hypothetical protein